MSQYRQTEVKLDFLDLISIETLIDLRIDELVKFQKEQKKDAPNGVAVYLAEDVVANYRVTLKKIRAAKKVIELEQREARNRMVV